MSHSKLTPSEAAALNIPEKRGRCQLVRTGRSLTGETGLTMLLVLVNPTLPFFSLHHKLIVSETCVDKGVDKRACEILSCRIHGGSSSGSCGQLGVSKFADTVSMMPVLTTILQMSLVNLLQALCFGYIELFAETLEILRQLRVVEDFRQCFIFGLERNLLTRENVCELTLHVAV